MTVEKYAEQYGKLHPKVRTALQSFFDIDLKSVQVKIVDHAPISTIWALADAVIVKRGILNYELIQEEHVENGKRWYTTNRAVDLSTASGIRILAHELKHCEQWRLTPRWKYWLWYLPALFQSYRTEKRYSHKFFRWEQEAIEFDKTVTLTESEKREFKKMQEQN